MERLTNNPTELTNAAKLEVEELQLKEGEKIIAYFSEFHLYAALPFRIALIEGQDGDIRSSLRQWDNVYNLSMWKNGIYNLDRLRIITEEKPLTETQAKSLKNTFIDLENKSLPQTIQSDSGIMMHGYEWKFGISHNHLDIDYEWTGATDDIELFVPVIELMKNQHSL